MISVNREAMKLVRQVLESAETLGVIVSRLKNGTTVIDMGQQARGSWLAGKYYSEITLGGLAEVSYEPFPFNDKTLTAVRVMVDWPIEACYASQIAGWRLEAREDAPIVCGPARALNQKPDAYFDKITYRDQYYEGVVSLQTSDPVTVDIAENIAQTCNLTPENLYILVASSTSLVCTIQVSARAIEQTMHRLPEEGLDVNIVRYAHGSCVIPPLADDELLAMKRINDALLYGTEATLYVEVGDDDISRVIGRITSSASPTYGQSFIDIYETYGRDFYNIPKEVHSPAVAHINNLISGRTFSAGEINYDVLQHSFFE